MHSFRVTPFFALSRASIVLALGFITAPESIAESPAPPLTAAAAIVIDQDTAAVLGVKNPDTLRPNPSTTKMMTALLAIERNGLNIDALVGPVSANAASTYGSTMGLNVGDRVSLRDLLYGLMLPSGNDAALTIAESISGTEDAFVVLMNQRAQSLGMTQTSYRNSFGYDPVELPAQCVLPYSSMFNCGHYSTVRDLSTLARFAIRQQSLFAQIAQTADWTPTTWVDSLNRPRTIALHNDNLLLSSKPYSGANGVKTGMSTSAGFCMVASATRSGHSILSVVLGCNSDESRHNESIQLLDFGFAQVLGPQGFANGGFEQALSNWTATGNFDLATGSASEGSQSLRFNGGQQPATAIVSQTFATLPGQSYTISFDYGIYSPVQQNQQQLEVTVTGNTVLFSQVVTRSAFTTTVQYSPQSFTFIADRSATTLTFRDVSTTTDSVDSFLDNVQLKAVTGATPTPSPTATGTPTQTPTPTASPIHTPTPTATPTPSPTATSTPSPTSTPSTADAAVVTNTGDSGKGSLRSALAFAFGRSRSSPPLTTTISFRIPKIDPGFDGSVFTIRLQAPLPSVPAGTTIDGSTQTLFTGTTNPAGPEIVLNGSRLGSFVTPGLVLNEANCVIRGLVINAFPQQGILISGSQASGNVIAGCYIGTNANGLVASANALSGIEIQGGAHTNTIGGSTASDRNVISGNSASGIKITDYTSDSNLISGNFIGANGAGTAGVPNALQGVAILNGARYNKVGGSTTGTSNRIWGNGREGVSISDAATVGNAVSQNSIFGNGARGIVLYASANGAQPFPVITSATSGASDQNAGGIDISGSLSSSGSTTFVIEFFANSVADPSGYGQGETFIGSTTIITKPGGTRSFTVSLPAAVPAGDFITAKATAANGDTSSYSATKVVAMNDSDGDGMPNKYEIAHGFNTTNDADAYLDADGDGMTNVEEYYAGTDPRSPTSRFAVSSLDFVANAPQITFQSVAGKTYRVEYSDDLAHGPWNVLQHGIFTVQATSVQVPDTATNRPARRLYRVVVEP